MQILVTGAGGFVGGHLLAHLRTVAPDAVLYGTIYPELEARPALRAICDATYPLDLRNADAVNDLMARVKPDRIFHLAGQAFVPRSFEAPWETFEHNVQGTLHLLEAIRTQKLSTRILIVGSAEIYGAAPLDALPLTEESAFLPSSPYSVSKISQDMLAWQYARAHGVYTVRVRPFNHIGPGQSKFFATPDWASQIAEAEIGKHEPLVRVGNLEAARDFTDVRDVVRAYWLALERGQPADCFNVCSGKPYSMQYILDQLVGESRVPIRIEVDEKRFRPVDIPILYGDYGRLNQRTGWSPKIPLEQSLKDVLEEWRAKILESA